MYERKEETTSIRSIYARKPFFTNPRYSLWKDKVFIEKDLRPKLMLLRNKCGYIYIAYNYDNSCKTAKSYWIIASLGFDIVIALLKNEEAIVDAFKTSKEIYESYIDFETGSESYKQIAASQLRPECLPEEEKYLNCSTDKYKKYINRDTSYGSPIDS